MVLALVEARAAADEGEVPVGAVTLIAGRVVAARHNERERANDPTAHAEILALRDTAVAVDGWRLSDVTLVVTLEPCPMCAGALVAARVGRLVFGASDPRAGACGTLYNLCADPRLNHELEVTAGVRAGECGALLSSFFAGKRADPGHACPDTRPGKRGLTTATARWIRAPTPAPWHDRVELDGELCQPGRPSGRIPHPPPSLELVSIAAPSAPTPRIPVAVGTPGRERSGTGGTAPAPSS